MTLCSARKELEMSLVCVIALSYPVGVTWFLSAGNSSYFAERAFQPASIESARQIPTLFIYGKRDQFTSLASFQDFFRDRIIEPKFETVIGNGDHFWHGKEQQLAVSVDVFLSKIKL